MPSLRGTEKKIAKLSSLGVIGRHKNTATKRTVYSLTREGFISIYSFGYNMEDSASLHRVSQNRANHYQMIAHVAAQFISPMGFFRDSLGIEPVPIEHLFSEHQMRRAYEQTEAQLKARAAKGESGDFGRWRSAALNHLVKLVEARRIEWSDVVESMPSVLTIGMPEVEEDKTKPVHQPDLAVVLDADRTGPDAQNLLVEVELNKKSWAAYEKILQTYKDELDLSLVYSRVVYFTIGTQVETLLRKVDKKIKTGLFDSGRLVVLPITHRDGSPVRFEKRISIREN
ncbi:hypothetical protein C5C20_01115 [Rathayibacter rathayi]|nr:hypothetical protein C5C08_01110 [Rathayibacter rathayi]PPF83590.1 hypothetical protein C5C14_01110 [Rathayibacter rathayi]PPG16143.1 hypothetical protein C5C11_00335 [Rathayibacter rathayi]PPG47409.1 hypothetical protein C5C20_01115 [Rathayibacter rathayi]PPI04974.1 hypothetical protein C5C43_01115 [Rathayibacter rathayi]